MAYSPLCLAVGHLTSVHLGNSTHSCTDDLTPLIDSLVCLIIRIFLLSLTWDLRDFFLNFLLPGGTTQDGWALSSCVTAQSLKGV